MLSNRANIIIIGGGPTGIGAALAGVEAEADWLLLEATDQMGGLASSFVDDAGFVWDLGGHVQFSHYATFDRYMDLAFPPEAWIEHERRSYVWIQGRFVPYPFQMNLHRLPPQSAYECLVGLLAASQAGDRQPPAHFGDWMRQSMGDGICDHFLAPYNRKVWAFPPEELGIGWLGERVAVPNMKDVLKGICFDEDQVGWGPNRTFRFPLHGGTGAIWKSLGARLPAERLRLGATVTQIDPAAKLVHTATGERYSYDQIISSMPLDKLTHCVPDVESPGQQLRFSSTHVVGIGLEGRPPAAIADTCWMYFPEANSPYYRVTVFSNYSPNNVPRPGQQWSLMAEVSESPCKPVQAATLVDDVVRAMLEDGLIEDEAAIVSRVHRFLPQGYPTPFLGRDALVDPLLRRLEERDIYSRGRFGAWKYEVSNQDHSFAQGWECMQRLLTGAGEEREPTLFTPHIVNSRHNP